jgi:hypothetical protein
MPEVEVFTPAGVLAGLTVRAPLTSGGPDLLTPLAVQDGRWYPIDGGPPAHRVAAEVQPDDILVIVTPAVEMMVHMTWYEMVLDVGPYRVTGSMATHPGFDPAKALARPTSTFVGLRDVTIELIDRTDTATAKREHVHVNRYAVERVESTLMLGHFFPGARLVTPEALPEAAPVG